MKPLFFLSIGLLALAGCEDDAIPLNELPANKKLDFTEFTMDVPATWSALPMQGIDSYVGGISMNDGQQATFDLGWYSNSLEVAFETHHVDFTRIDGLEAKLVSPVTPGRGTTGVYFANLNDGGLLRFEMHGEDLSAENQDLLIEAFQTLDFK
jgi:hypothetical protein